MEDQKDTESLLARIEELEAALAKERNKHVTNAMFGPNVIVDQNCYKVFAVGAGLEIHGERCVVVLGCDEGQVRLYSDGRVEISGSTSAAYEAVRTGLRVVVNQFRGWQDWTGQPPTH